MSSFPLPEPSFRLSIWFNTIFSPSLLGLNRSALSGLPGDGRDRRWHPRLLYNGPLTYRSALTRSVHWGNMISPSGLRPSTHPPVFQSCPLGSSLLKSDLYQWAVALITDELAQYMQAFGFAPSTLLALISTTVPFLSRMSLIELRWGRGVCRLLCRARAGRIRDCLLRGNRCCRYRSL
jgi:hypothetical protein